MSIPRINAEITQFLSSNGIEPLLDASQEDSEKLQHLFEQMTTLTNASEDPKLIAGMTKLLAKITPQMKGSDPRCQEIFTQTTTAVQNKRTSLSNNPLTSKTLKLEFLRLLPLEEMRLLSKKDILKILNLDTWETEGDKNRAMKIIIECFLKSSKILNLRGLHLSSLPPNILEHLSLYELDLSHNNLTSFILNSSSLNLRLLDISYNKLASIHLPSPLRKLWSLNLSHNLLPSITLPSTLTELQHLDLFQNQLHSITFSNDSMNNLTRMSLSQNRLRSITLPSSMDDLRRMDLADNLLSERPNLSSYYRLEIINLEGNPFVESSDPLQAPFLLFKDKLRSDSPYKDFDDTLLKADPNLFSQIHTWLDKLRTANDFKEGSSSSQAFFSERVLAILDLVAKEPEFQEIFKAALSEALTTCVDRSTLLLNAMELNRLIFLAKDQSLPAIASLLKSAFTLEKINEFSTNFVNHYKVECAPEDIRHDSGGAYVDVQGVRYIVYYIDEIPYRDGVDPIEVYLGFQVRLKEDFNLPIITEGMNYFRCSKITPKDELTIRKSLRASLENHAEVARFLCSTDIWKNQMEQEFAKDLEALRAPFHESLELVRESEKYSNADSEVQKTVLESTTTKMTNTKQAWLEHKTLDFL